MNIDERVYGYEPAASQLKELRSEIERLRSRLQEAAKLNIELMQIRRENDTEIEQFRFRIGAMISVARERAEEVERLRGELTQWKRVANEGHPQPCTLGSQCPYCEIERLRNLFIETAAKHEGVLIKRDDEIEQLRKDFTDLLRLAANDASQYQSEIERLRLTVNGYRNDVDQEVNANEVTMITLFERDAEIERLRKELAEKDDYIRTVSSPIGAHSYE